MSSFWNKPRKGAVKNFLFPCITCYLLLPQMQGNMIASLGDHKIMIDFMASNWFLSTSSKIALFGFFSFFLFFDKESEPSFLPFGF